MDYKVAVKTPLGRFNTIVEITYSEDGSLIGEFVIMGLKSTFTGKKLEEEKIDLNGMINTPIGPVEYSSRANVKEKDFEGVAHTKVGDFEFMPLVRKKRR